MDEKLTSENMQKKSSFLCLWYILRAVMAGRCRERRYADHIYSDILQNVPFRSQNFFASGGKGALTPVTKTLQTFLPSKNETRNPCGLRSCKDMACAVVRPEVAVLH